MTTECRADRCGDGRQGLGISTDGFVMHRGVRVPCRAWRTEEIASAFTESMAAGHVECVRALVRTHGGMLESRRIREPLAGRILDDAERFLASADEHQDEYGRGSLLVPDHPFIAALERSMSVLDRSKRSPDRQGPGEVLPLSTLIASLALLQAS